MEYVSNLTIAMTWVTSLEEFEEKGMNGWKTRKEWVARNTFKGITYGLKMDDQLPEFPGVSSPIQVGHDQDNDGMRISINWTLPYNLSFPTRSKRNRFLDNLDKEIREMSRVGVVKGDFPIEECLALMAEFFINSTYNRGKREETNLATYGENVSICCAKLITRNFDIATIWKLYNCSAVRYRL